LPFSFSSRPQRHPRSTLFPYTTLFRSNHAIRITKEREHKQSKEHQYSGGKIPMKQESGATGYERRQPKVIAFFDHADARRPPPFRSRFSRGEQAWPFYDSFLCRKAGIAWILLLPQNPRSNPLHFILTVELHLFQFDFF